MDSKFSAKNSLLWGVIALVAGFVIIFNADKALTFIIELLGALLTVIGAVELITFFIQKNKKNLSWGAPIFAAIAAIIFGLVLIFNPAVLLTAFMFIIGAVIALLGVWQIVALQKYKKLGAKFPSNYYVAPIVLAIAGIAMLFFPKTSSTIFVIFAGFFVALFGLTEIIASFVIKLPEATQNDTKEA